MVEDSLQNGFEIYFEEKQFKTIVQQLFYKPFCRNKITSDFQEFYKQFCKAQSSLNQSSFESMS